MVASVVDADLESQDEINQQIASFNPHLVKDETMSKLHAPGDRKTAPEVQRRRKATYRAQLHMITRY